MATRFEGDGGCAGPQTGVHYAPTSCYLVCVRYDFLGASASFLRGSVDRRHWGQQFELSSR